MCGNHRSKSLPTLVRRILGRKFFQIRICGPCQVAFLKQLGYVDSMGKVKSIDPFVSNEPDIQVDALTSRMLKQRVRTAGHGEALCRLIPANEARERMHEWLSKSSTTKTR